MATAWQNRIIGYGEEAPDQLLTNPKNWRIHPKYQQDALSGVLREVGIVQNIVVNQRTGFVVDGHLRVALALRESQPIVPVTYVDLHEEEEALILATLDPIGAQAGTDPAKLDDLLREVSTGDAAVQELLAKLAGQHGEPIDPAELWKGMPEFEQEDLEAYKKTVVHFAREEDYQAFFRLIGQPPNAKAIWFPLQSNVPIGVQVEDES